MFRKRYHCWDDAKFKTAIVTVSQYTEVHVLEMNERMRRLRKEKKDMRKTQKADVRHDS